MAKKLLAFILTFTLVLSAVASVITVTALDTDVNVWDGTIAEAFAGGSGTKDDPYKISNGAELAYMFNSVITTGSSFCNNKYFKLTADIYLNDVTNENWKDSAPNQWLTSKSDNGKRFTGNFDGGCHTVYGMYYSGEASYVGLLPVMDVWSYDLTVKDLYISDSYIHTTGAFVSAVTPRIYSGNKHTANFYNIYVKDSVTVESTDTSATAYVSGIAGFIQSNASSYYQFSGCAVLGSISSGHALMGYGAATTVANIAQSYTNAADWYPTNSKTGSTTYFISDLSSITGKDAAKAAMPGFDWLRIWNCKDDGYPFPMDYNTNNIAGLPWSGLWAIDYAAGSGTAEDPYIIETPEQLAKLVRRDTTTDGKYYALTKDIYLNDISKDFVNEWYDYTAAEKNVFKGIFDGQGHTVYGLYFANATDKAGLFSAVGLANKTVYIKNLTISNSSINSSASGTGAIAGTGNGSGSVLSFYNCHVTESVSISSTGESGAAALIAYNGNATVNVDSCSVRAQVSAAKFPGAFFGDFWGGTLTVKNSYSAGAPISGRRTFTSTNNYSTVADTFGTKLVTEEQIQGLNALDNMPLLTGYASTDGYPTRYMDGTAGAVWNGAIAPDYAGGSGTKADPYKIATAEQLAKLIHDATTAGKYYILTADIYLNDISKDFVNEWYTSKCVNNIFSGSFDGEGHTIYGMYYKNADSYTGIFNSIAGTVSVKNVTLSDSSITSAASGTGAVIGNATGTVALYNCHVTESVSISSTGISGAAALIAYNSPAATVDSCSVRANVSGVQSVGAFFGDIWGSGTFTVKNSYASGNAISTKKTFTGTNNYGTVADGYETNVVSAEQMQGLNALDNMPLLTGYVATEGYPVRYTDGKAGTVWSGSVASKYAGGSGTKADPYVIKTPEQFARMVTTSSNNNYYALGADLIFSDDTTANCWFDSAQVSAFAGNFDGNGYIVSGLYYEKSTSAANTDVGLIPVASGAVVRNVILEDSSISLTTNTDQPTYIGGIVGYITGETTIQNCYVAEDVALSNKVSDGITTVKTVVGGILGGGQAPFVIDGCSFFGTLDFSEYRYGAVFGDRWNGTVADRIIKNTVVDNYTPSSYWGFEGENNITVAAVTGTTDVDGSFTVVDTVKGEEGAEAIANVADKARIFATENYPAPTALGARFMDVNGDRESNALDLITLKKYLFGITALGYTDLNSDGEKNIIDLIYLRKRIADENGVYPYVLVWNDEFEGTALDSSKWRTDQTRMYDYDDLVQTYAGYVQTVDDGNLKLTAQKNPWYNASSDNYFEQHKYVTTGSISTENRMSFQYGYLEVRAKVPYKVGCWPSIWLRSHNATGRQANANYQIEVDIMEVFGSRTTMSSNLHQQQLYGTTDSCSTTAEEISKKESLTFENTADLSNEYHLYGLEWTEEKMAIYVDRVLLCEWYLDDESLASYGLRGDASGFDTTLNLLFNNHLFVTGNKSIVGGTTKTINWNEGNLPSEYDIDYVRLYQKYDGLSKLIIGE